MEVVGILLAAGRGERFDASGRQLKLLAARGVGADPHEPLAVAAARALRAAVGSVIAVVRPGREPGQARLHGLLAALGCVLVECAPARREDEGMGRSIACGVAARPQAAGWIIALADMPSIAPATIAAVRAAIAAGAASAAPCFRGRRGHPVGFGASCGAELAALDGDAGARALLLRHPPQLIAVDDPGILFDVDRPGDLPSAAGRAPGAIP